MKNEKQKIKTKKGKIADFRLKNINPSQKKFLTSSKNISFSRSPPTWTYMGELNIPFSGRVSRFAEFFFIDHKKSD